MVNKKLTDFQTYSETPYIEIEGLEYRKYWTKESPEEFADRNGEIYQMTKIMRSVTGFKDKAPYSKLFKGGKLKLTELSAPGIRVLAYIMLNAKPNTELICLYPPDVAREMGYLNQKNVYGGLVNLLENGLMARCVGNQSCFWINPNLLFNGDRRKLLDNPVRALFSDKLEQDWVRRTKEFVTSRKD